MADRFKKDASRATHEVASWVPPVARIGYAAKGAVYLLIGYIAAKAAFAADSPKGATGALGELLNEGGRGVVLLMGVGLLAHALWRFVEAALDPEHRGQPHRVGARLAYLGSGLVYGWLALTAFKLSQGRGGGESGGEKSFAATLMAQPYGRWFVGAIGVAVIGYGIHQVILGFRGDVTKDLGIRDPDKHRAVVAIGRIGTAARGVVFGIIGTFFIDAARHYNAKEAGGIQDALGWLGQSWLLMAVALGLMAYGLLQFAKAWYRRIEAPR